MFFRPKWSAAGQDRHLESFELRFTRGTTPGLSAILFDLIGYYPLIDGDSTDTMITDNTAILPRYQDGVGVIPVFISYIAPSVQNGIATMTYIGTDDVERSVTFNIFNSSATGGVVVSVLIFQEHPVLLVISIYLRPVVLVLNRLLLLQHLHNTIQKCLKK